MNELDFLKHINHMLEECGLEGTYLNDIVKCRQIIKDRIEQVKNCSIPAVMVRSEQLPCSHCGRPLKEHSKDSKLCPDRMKHFEQGN
jgi:hypothetical protein